MYILHQVNDATVKDTPLRNRDFEIQVINQTSHVPFSIHMFFRNILAYGDIELCFNRTR